MPLIVCDYVDVGRVGLPVGKLVKSVLWTTRTSAIFLPRTRSCAVCSESTSGVAW